MNFIILGLPKTGKTMLVNTLDRLDGFRVLGEIFVTRGGPTNMPDHPMKLINEMRERDKRNNFHTWWHKTRYPDGVGYLKGTLNDITNFVTQADVYGFLDEFFTSDINCGFKLHQHHIESVPYIKGYIKTDPNIKILHCNRRNKVKQALAAIGNRARGAKFKAGGKGTLGVIKDYQKRTTDLYRWFREGPNPYKEIFYEDMTGDTNIEKLDLRPIKEFFEEDWCLNIPESIEILTKKNTQNKVSENLLNYDEFVEFFRGTEYFEMID